MKKRLGKRAEHELYFFIFTLIMVGAIVLALVNFQSRVAQADTLDNLFLSRDIALLMDAAGASPDTLQYTYTGAGLDSFSAQNYTFSKNMIEIDGEKYIYAANAYVPLTPEYISQPKSIIITTGGKLALTTDTPPPPSILLTLPIVKTTYTSKIGTRLASQPPYSGADADMLRRFTKEITLTNTAPDILITLEFTDENKAEAFIPPASLRSRRLAAILLNDIITSYNPPSTAIHIGDDPLLAAPEAAVHLRLNKDYIKPGALQDALKQYDNG